MPPLLALKLSMRFLARSIISRIIVGLVIAMAMFYFREANAATWPAPRGPAVCEVGTNAVYYAYRNGEARNNRGPFATYQQATQNIYQQGPEWNQSDNSVCAANSPGCNIEQSHTNGQHYTIGTVERYCAPGAPPPGGCVADPEGAAPIVTGVVSSKCIDACSIASFQGDDNKCVSIQFAGEPETSETCGVAGTRWRKDGGTCTGDAVPNPNGEKCQMVQGNTVCTGGTTPRNCIKVNGGLSCGDSSGGVCATPECQALASAVKNPDGSATVMKDTPTPTAPNTGTPGERAASAFDYGQNHGTPTSNYYSYYSPTTVNNSYNGDGSVGNATKPATNTDPQENGQCGREGQPACENNEDGEKCGGVGQPACTTKIDERGTPGAAPDNSGKLDALDGQYATARQAIQTPAAFQGATADLVALIPSWSGASCTTIDLFTWKGETLRFPGTSGCSMLESIKALLAYLLAAFTTYWILRRFIERLGGGNATAG